MDAIFSWKDFMDAIRNQWKEAGKELIFTILGTLSPTLSTWGYLAIKDRPYEFNTFFQNGEFALYSTALIVSFSYLVVKESKLKLFFQRWFFYLISFLVFAVSIFIYAIVVSSTKAEPFNISLVTTITLLAFVVTVVFAFFVKVIDLVRFEFDYRATNSQGYNDLIDKFEKGGNNERE
ncbi:MAG: hypothetical protein AB1454_06665 [Candidatus Auribacterota bacterium]